MTPIARDPGKRVSLTKHYRFDELVEAIGDLEDGLTQEEVATRLGSQHAELADDLFEYENGGLVVDALVTACQRRMPEAPLLLWTALLVADERLQTIVSRDMTLPSGLLDPGKFSVVEVRMIMQQRVGGASADKAASNLLRWFVTSGVARPSKSGASVVGLAEPLPTAFAVPKIVELVTDRLARRGFTTTGAPDASVNLALGLGVNHWVNLTPDEFRAAARGRPVPAIADKTPRDVLPGQLALLHRELIRKRQAILQGPPGTGKTHLARQYVKWFTARREDESRISAIARDLPESERTPARIVDEIQARGTPGVWEIVQFHPSYSYERFVRGLQATPVPGGVSFVAADRLLGILAAVASELEARSDLTEVLLVIDEINRADLAKVFGELLYALEYRDEPVSSPYAVDGDSTLVLPHNLSVIGTMNTADQSIAMVDKALRRRFAWLHLRPDREVLETAEGFLSDDDRSAALWLFDQVSELFDPTDVDLARLQPGHSYFLADGGAADSAEAKELLARRFSVECWPLLEEYEAEGLLDPDQVAELLRNLGWSTDTRPTNQDELAAQINARLNRRDQAPVTAASHQPPDEGATAPEPKLD